MTFVDVFARMTADEARIVYEVLAERAEDESGSADAAEEDAVKGGAWQDPARGRGRILAAIVERLDAVRVGGCSCGPDGHARDCAALLPAGAP